MRRTSNNAVSVTLLLLLSLSLSGCATHEAREALTLSPESLEHRQMQTRRFEGIDEKDMLSACAGVLQDLGFVLDESESELGLLVASKKRDASDTGQQVAAIVMLLLFGAPTAVDEEQIIRVSLITRPVTTESGDNHIVRITFQREVTTDQHTISAREPIRDPVIYQEFYEKLSKSVFLEAQKI